MGKGLKVIGAALLVVAAVQVFGDDGEPPASGTSARAGAVSPSSRSYAAPPASSPPTASAATSTATVAPVTTSPAPPAKPPATIRTYLVTEVVDGDTIVIANGARIRLIGIDAPERDECGSAAATKLLASYILGKQVILTGGAQTDQDRYGRLLRFVNLGRSDVGLKMIQSGRAIARYDSRDGYGAHPREDEYIAADDASPDANVCAPVRLVPDPAPAPADVFYANCAAARAAGAAPLHVGEPGYRLKLDGDKDGVACER